MKKPSGAPMWMTTFADMMSLLMCFFVLLLSFAEMDIEKFKQIAGSMKVAFGVQRVIKAQEAPADDSAVVGQLTAGGTAATPKDQAYERTQEHQSEPVTQTERPEPQKVEAELERIREALAREIKEGKLDVEGGADSITLRIQEKGAFPSGSADVVRGFAPLLERIGRVLETTQGKIAIAGHTDDRPIKTKRYRSNWELSTSRAVTVVHHLLALSGVDPSRVEVRGHGDSIPLVPNDSTENRAVNRRVEIIVSQVETSGDGAPAGGQGEAGEGISPEIVEQARDAAAKG